MKRTMAVIDLGNRENICYVDEKEIRQATYNDFMSCSWEYDLMGLDIVGENENGEKLFTGHDFDGKKTWDELKDIKTDWYAVSYFDGHNHQVDVFESYYIEEIEIKRNEEDDPKPALYYCYNIIINNEILKAIKSNESGSISPYYIVEKH